MEYNILTLYVVKDREAFNERNFKSVLSQKGVKQDVYIISAKPLNLPKTKNIVIPVPQNYPLPVRVSFSVNAALKSIGDIGKYTHIFKVDGDMALPTDYLVNLLQKKALVAGRGPALLISINFFRKFLNGKYPVSYRDDGYILALSISLGCWPPEYDGKDSLKIPWNPELIAKSIIRVYYYGREDYKWGTPIQLFIIISLLQTIKNLTKHLNKLSIFLKVFVYSVAGYLSALLNNEKRYPWWRNYASERSRHLATKFTWLISHAINKILLLEF